MSLIKLEIVLMFSLENEMNRNRNRIIIIIFAAFAMLLLSSCAANPELAAPGVTLSVTPDGQPQQVTTGVQLLVLLTVLSVAPTILILATSFTRIVIVLSMLRNAIGTPSIPPNQVVIGLSLLLTFFIMSPVYGKINENAIQPYVKNEITQEEAFTRAVDPIREFMFKQTREKDIALFMDMSGKERPNTIADIDTVDLFPAFVISELRTAFTMGFIIYIPFLIIDLVISSVLLSMGMMMLPPSLISLPFKVLLFVLVDGWYLIAKSLMLSFMK
jgi:flagellar biosynthesis protein FliP